MCVVVFNMKWCNCVYLLLFSVCLIGLTDSITLDDLLPFGTDNGDLSLPIGSDVSITVSLPNWFVYYKQRFKTLHISVNGLVSFLSPIYGYDSTLFSQDIPFITPFLADTDTSGTGHVWYNVNNDQYSAQSQYVSEKIALFFEDDTFVPLTTVTVTWDEVGYFPMKVDKVNTFQCVLATNGNSSYVMFLYPNNGIDWYQADDRDGVTAQVGFNKGCGDPTDVGSGDHVLGSGYVLCGIHKTLEDVMNIDQGSNIQDGSPGFYMWMVSSSSIVDGVIVCNNKDLQSITITPNNGHQFGGIPVIISGPCFGISDEVQCAFGPNIIVNGVVIDDNEALCISPSFKTTVPVSIKLYINNIAIAPTATFSIVPYYDSADVMKTNDDLLLRDGSSITLTWNPTQLLPSAPTNSYLINIAIYRLKTPQDDSPSHWSNGTTLSSDVFNEGQATIDILTGSLLPSMPDETPYELVLLKLVFVPTMSSSNKYITGLSNIVNTYNAEESVGLWSHPLILVVRNDQDYCNQWVNNANYTSLPSSGMCDGCVPSCPCNVMQAMIPNSGFVLSSSTPGAKILNRFLHPQAPACFTSLLSVSDDGYDAAQMCCYDDNGDLLVGLPNGGYQLAVSSLSSLPWSLYFLLDISPYIGCCMLGLSAECLSFYNERSSDNCQSFTPWTPGWCVGDPHLVTLDGVQYTFNGRGEFILLTTETTDSSQLMIQGRMIPLSLESPTDGGTVLSSISVLAGYDVIEMRADDGRVLVLINGTHFHLSIGLWHHFVGYTIIAHDNSNVRLLFNNWSASLDVTQSMNHKYFTGITISVDEEFAGKTTGLLGNYNNNPNDDLLPKNSLWPLSLNATLQEIHESFGLSWIITESAGSLFTYDQSDSFSTYYHPNYVPAFQVSFVNSTLQSDAVTECQGNEPCLFDVAATEIIQVGVATRKEMENVDTVIELSKPIRCDPSCVHGACVDTNQCHCSYGYHGSYCDTPTYEECSNESNPCLNNGQCSLHLFNYICNCPSKFTGQYCETADCGPLLIDPSSSVLSVSYDSTVGGSVAMYSCITGYNLMGNQYSTCLNNGSWSYNNPYCVIVDCGAPPVTNSPFLSVSYLSTLYTAVSTYSCNDEQYKLRNGDIARSCTATGTWSGSQPTCLIDCGIPLALGYGVDTDYNDTVEGSVAVYTCINSEYELYGQDTITCWSNGTWSYSSTGCREVPFNTRLYIIIGASIAGSVLLFTSIVLIVTCTGIILNKIRTSKKDEYELTEI